MEMRDGYVAFQISIWQPCRRYMNNPRMDEESEFPFMPSSCPPLHSAFIIAVVYQHSGGCVL